jgi:NADH-quinone oxidoreductase subunit E
VAWTALDRQKPVDGSTQPVLSEAVRAKIRSFFPRYETKRAVLLPALHVVQHTLGHVSPRAMVEIAELLEIHPSDVLDTISFYTHFWTHPKGQKVITVCRSISCEIMGAAALLDELKKNLKIDEHGTTSDGEYSLVTEECLAGCDDKIDFPRSDLFDPPSGHDGDTSAAVISGNGKSELGDDVLETTSDVREMREAN